MNLSYPKAPAVFAGRKKILDQLKTGFLHYNVLIIDGMPGTGKTALSLYFASTIDSSPDFLPFYSNVLWIQCEEGWRTETLLYEINRLFKERGEDNFDGYLKDNDRDGIVKCLIFLLNNSNYTIFIDDYHRISENKTFIELCAKFLRKSRVVFISRERPDFLPMEWMDIFEVTIHSLGRHESFIMIKKLLELHGCDSLKQHIMEEIYSRTGGHPFLIKSFLSLLVSGDKTAEELLSHREFSGDYICSQLIKGLKERERDLLVSFSVYRKPVRRDGLILIYSYEDIDCIIEVLKKKFLIELDGDKRYSMDGLLRDFCYEQGDKKHLHKLCASYYTERINREGYTLDAGKEAFYHYFKGEDFEKAIELLAIIMGEMALYFQLGELEEYIDKIVKITEDIPSSFFLVKAEILRVTGRSKEAVKLLESKAAILPLYEKHRFLILLSRILSRLGEWDRAMDIIRTVIPVLQEQREDLASAYACMGSIYRRKGDYISALDYYKKSLDLNKKTDKKLELSLKQSMAITMSKNEVSEEHINLLEGYLKEAETLNFPDLKLSFTNNLALACYDIGNYDKSLKLWMNNIENCRNFGWKEAIMHSLVSSSLLFEETGEPQRAISQYTEALHISRTIEDNYFQCLILCRLGSLYLMQGEMEKGIDFTEKAMTIASKYGFKELLSDININAGEIHFIKGDKDRASQRLNDVLSGENIHQLARAYRLKYILDMDVHLKDRSDEHFSLLKGYRKRRCEQYFAYLDDISQRIFPLSSERMYIVKMRDRQYDANIDEIESLRKRKEDFDIFLDGIDGTVMEKSMGTIELYRKKSLSDLLFFFARNSGKFFSPADLFPQVWKAKYVHMTDCSTVKMSVSRIRKLIEPHPEEPKYLKLSPVRYKEERKYYFDDWNNYCFIEGKSCKK
ncbi:MAG: tetratricopeptide repeat protein [Candidatus Eremiobacterota bacterium]